MDLQRGDVATDTTLRCSVHTGTHVDAPAHFLSTGRTIDAVPLDTLIGPAMVIDVGDVSAIEPEVFEQLNLPRVICRLVIKTRNSRWWADGITNFREDFVALTASGAQWLVDHGIQLVGIDYLSIQRFHDDSRTHTILLKANVVIVEGLTLAHVTPGVYEFCCLPLRLQNVEAAPARAVLWPVQNHGD